MAEEQPVATSHQEHAAMARVLAENAERHGDDQLWRAAEVHALLAIYERQGEEKQPLPEQELVTTFGQKLIVWAMTLAALVAIVWILAGALA